MTDLNLFTAITVLNANDLNISIKKPRLSHSIKNKQDLPGMLPPRKVLQIGQIKTQIG